MECRRRHECLPHPIAPPLKRMPIAALILSLIAVAALWLAAGNSLGLWLGGFGVVAILLPALSLRRETMLQRFVDAAVVTDCVVAVWLISTLVGEVKLIDCLLCTAVLYAFALLGFGIANLLRRCRLPMEFTVLFVTIGLLAWLASPVWLSQWMNDSIAGFLSQFHPLLAINARLTPLGIWLEQGVIYRHSVLGQDVPYALPESVWPTTLLQASIGGFGLFLAFVLGPKRCEPQINAD